MARYHRDMYVIVGKNKPVFGKDIVKWINEHDLLEREVDLTLDQVKGIPFVVEGTADEVEELLLVNIFTKSGNQDVITFEQGELIFTEVNTYDPKD